MKSQHILFPASLIILAIFAVTFLVPDERSVVATNQLNQPTLAPTATPGDSSASPASIPLAQPLETKEQALEQLLVYDAALSVWSQPWSKDTLYSDPDRITVELYPGRTAESIASGWNEWFAPEIEADAGAVWSITIKGDVRVTTPSPRARASNAIYDGVTYVLSQRTRNLLTVRTGPPK